MSEVGFHANPHSTDPMRNTARAVTHTGLPPKRRVAHPLIGIATAEARAYPVTVHWMTGIVVWKAPASSLRAMLTMLLSSSGSTEPKTNTTTRRRVRVLSRPSSSIERLGTRSLWSVIVRVSLAAAWA